MEAAVFGFVGVVIGGIVTGWFAIRAESIRSDKEAALDSARRADDRKIERDRFDRETLLAVQETMGQLHELVVRMMTGSTDAEFPWRFQVVTGQIIGLRSRVVDSELRDYLSKIIQTVGKMSPTRPAEAQQEPFNAYGAVSGKATDRCGELIVATYRDREIG